MTIDQNTIKLSPRLLGKLAIVYLTVFTIIFVIFPALGHVDLKNEQIHTLIETSGAIASLLVAILLLTAARQEHVPKSYTWMAYGFISMGILDILHASVPPGSVFIWLHSTAVILGGLFFSGMWICKRFTDSMLKTSVFAATTLLVFAFGLLSILYEASLPSMVHNGEFTITPRLFNILGGLLFFSVMVYFLRRAKINFSLDDFVFANLCFLFGSAGLVFEFSHLWHGYWWAWHFLRIIAPLVIFYYMFYKYTSINSKLRSNIAEFNSAKKDLEEKTHFLGERNKELNCLYGITELIDNKDMTLEEIFQKTVNLIPPSWQYPDITESRISCEDAEYQTSSYKDSPWKQSADIIVNNEPYGVLEVCYLESKPKIDEGPFLKEERALINSIVKLLGDAIEKKETEDALRLSEKRYRQLFDSISYGYAIHEIIVDEETGEPIDYRFLDINRAFNTHTAIESTTGLKTSEIIGKTVLEVMPQIEAYWIQEYGKVAQTGIPIEFEAPAAELGKYYHVVAFQNQPGQFAVMFSDITEKKKAEDEIRKLTRAVEQSGSAIIITDLDGNIEYANPAFYANTGYSPNETLGQNPKILKSGHHGPEFYSQMWQTLTSGKIWRGELVNKKKNGELYWEAATISPVMDSDNKTTHYVAVKDDITNSKRIAEALKASEEKYRLLFETMEHGIVVQDRNGVIIDANSAAKRMLGLSSEQIQGKTPMDPSWNTIHEDGSDFPGETHPAMIALNTGKNVHDTVMGVFNPEENRHIWILLNSVPQFTEGSDDLVGVYTTFSDITSLKQMESKLLESRNRYQEFIEGTSNLVSRVDQYGRFEFINHMSYPIYGLKPEECIGRNAFDFIHPEDREYTQKWFADAVEQKLTNSTLENRQIHLNGEIIDMIWTVNFIFDESNQLVGANSISQNISEQKLFERELKIAQQRAIAANKAKSTFLANMSHELRTPLNAIIGFSQILEKQIKNKISEKQAGFFNNIITSGHHLLEMVNDILDLSKIEAGKLELNFAPFDFGAMLKRTPDIVRNMAYEKKIKIQTDIQQNLGWLAGDETKLKQVIYNLLSNAIKFTQPGKSIGIKARAENRTFRITVWDEGIGIPVKDLERVFHPFEQVQDSNSLNSTGTGLGLAISKKLIELHHGKIEATSQPGSGSRFTITLHGRISMDDGYVSENNMAGSATEIEENKRDDKILVTEDNPVNRELFEACLSHYSVDFATTGEEAILLAEKKQYDLILMDIQLPGMDGMQTMKKLREKTDKKVPIIAVTAFAMKGDREYYLDQGFDDYVSKPVDVDHLLAKVEEQLDRQPDD